MTEPIDAQSVLTLARAQGQSWLDEEAAKRIAVAATAAVRAVEVSMPQAVPVLLEDAAAEFLARLEALSEGPA
jgi:hypothetical protein